MVHFQQQGVARLTGGDERICRFGTKRLAPLNRALKREIAGVRIGADPEHIHRVRVASRRLRIALPIFSSCFPTKQYYRWTKSLREISRALGSARDTDVQIQFLDRYLRDHSQTIQQNEKIWQILSFLQERRKTNQEEVLSGLDALERKAVLQEISNAFKKTRRDEKRADEQGQSEDPLPTMAAASIETAFDHLLVHGYSVRDPDDITGHHTLRIAAKKLRYTLEVFRSLFPDRLKPAINDLKNLQELLGEIHDCDVWIEILSGTQPGTVGQATSETLPLPQDKDDGSIAALLGNRRNARQEYHSRLVREWEETIEQSLKDYLSSLIRVQEDKSTPLEQIRGTTGSNGILSVHYPEGADHARQVTRLALQIYDSLALLHKYGRKERQILEYAGLLHDIGWVYGQKGHHVRSGRMILVDTSLPVIPHDREIIALVARYHRKRVPKKPPQTFSFLKPKALRRVLLLASLLRIADGLDYTHANRVISLSCTIAPDAVICNPVFDGDGTIERTRALKKADLFEKTFGRRFLIP